MKFFILFSINILIIQAVALAWMDYPVYSHSSVMQLDVEDVRVAVEGIEIVVRQHHQCGQGKLSFEILMENISSDHKKDIKLPLSVILRDNLGNRYRDIFINTPGISDSGQLMSLYPGDHLRFDCCYEAPVNRSEMLFLDLADARSRFQYQVQIPTKKIENWESFSGNRQVSEDDLLIVFPRDKIFFHPGEKVFLKIDFSQRAGRPDTIYVVSADYSMRDEKASGKYELYIPEDAESGEFPIVVMAEWDPQADDVDPVIISKTLMLQIKG